MDINCLRAVECIPSVCLHSKQLRSEIAFRFLLGYFDKVEDEEEVIRQLTLINLKDKTCDLFRIYNYLVLTENWFLYNPMMKEKTLLNEMWGLYLRNCCCQINITDTRSYASKVCMWLIRLLYFYNLVFCCFMMKFCVTMCRFEVKLLILFKSRVIQW